MERPDRVSGDAPQEAIALSLDRAWPLPRDTYIIDGFPELLTRLSFLPSIDPGRRGSTEE